MKNNKTKIGIVLEGGGAKGAYQIGVLKALLELGINYSCVIGTSIGALNGVFYTIKDYDKAEYLWKNIDFSFNKNNTKENNIATENKKNDSMLTKIDVFQNKKLLDFDYIRNNIEEFEKEYLNTVGIDSEKTIKFYKEIINEDLVRDSDVIFGLTTYCLTDKICMGLLINEIPRCKLAEFVFASCALPVFTPTKIDGKYYLDGSLYNRLPIDLALRNNLDIIICIRLRPENYDYSKYKKNSKIKIIDIFPSEILSKTLEADKKRINWMLHRGYEDSMKILKEKLINLV